MRVRWLRRALRNLEEEAEYIARDDPNAAARIVDRIATSVERLGTHPASGRIGRVPGTRELVVSGTPYIVPYRVRGETVEILRVFSRRAKMAREVLAGIQRPKPKQSGRALQSPRADPKREVESGRIFS